MEFIFFIDCSEFIHDLIVGHRSEVFCFFEDSFADLPEDSISPPWLIHVA